MAVSLSLLAGAGWQFLDDNANPLTGGLLYTYAAGTTTPLATYTSSSGSTPNANPIVLDAAGRVSQEVWLTVGSDYKFILKNSTGVTIWTKDDIPGGLSSDAVTFLQAGTGAVERTAQAKMRDTVSVKDFGAGTGASDDSAAIQAAIDYLSSIGGGTVYFPPGTYNLQSQLVPKSNVNYRGEGKTSLIAWNSTSAGYFFNQDSANLENVVWDGIGFDGTINYITDPTIYKQTYTRTNTAIRTGGVAAKNVTVRNCYFKNLSNGSIDFNGELSDGVFVLNNTFINGCYVSKVVSVRTPSGSPTSDAARPQNILYDGNYVSGGGPTAFYDASKEAWIASTDGLSVDSCKDVIISNNTVIGIASIGIRVEQTLRAKVIGNTVKETGATGIAFYNDCFDGACVGNTVQNWGKIPPAYAIRSYSGNYYAAKEFPDAVLAPLPADPSVSAWFYAWPYALSGVNLATIIAYANTQYYPAANGILPYRGEAAISVTQGSQKINVVGNNVVGDITTSGGLYNYSSDYGVSCVHPSNGPSGQQFSPRNSMITGNGVVDARVYRIWHPQFADPINYNTASYNTGEAVYSANRDSSSLIWSGNVRLAQDGQLIALVDAGSTGRSNFQANWINFPATQSASSDANTLDDYEEGLFDATINVASGTVTQQYIKLAYTKVGRQVTVTGELNLTNVGTPSGAVTVTTLPFPNSGLNQRASRNGFYVYANNLTGVTSGHVVGYIEAGSSTINLDFYEAGVVSNLGTKLSATTAFRFDFSYFTTT